MQWWVLCVLLLMNQGSQAIRYFLLHCSHFQSSFWSPKIKEFLSYTIALWSKTKKVKFLRSFFFSFFWVWFFHVASCTFLMLFFLFLHALVPQASFCPNLLQYLFCDCRLRMSTWHFSCTVRLQTRDSVPERNQDVTTLLLNT